MPSFQEVLVDPADDGHEVANTTWTDVDVWFAGTYNANVYHGGVRFLVDDGAGGPPQGATILGATLTCDVVTLAGTPTTSIVADAVDDAPAWSSTSRPSQITPTAAAVAWTPTAVAVTPVDITPVVQEIVNRPGWLPGNEMRFAILNTAASGLGIDHSFSVDSINDAEGEETLLDINYTIDPTGEEEHLPQRSSRIIARERS